MIQRLFKRILECNFAQFVIAVMIILKIVSGFSSENCFKRCSKTLHFTDLVYINSLFSSIVCFDCLQKQFFLHIH